jgi:PhnB protein
MRSVMELSIFPELSVRRGRDVIEFYAAAFDARVIYKVGGTEENPAVVAELAIGDASFWVSDEAPDCGNHSPESLDGCTVRLLLRVEDPDATQTRAVRHGAIEISPVQEARGWLIGRIADPFGHYSRQVRRTITTPRENVGARRNLPPVVGAATNVMAQCAERRMARQQTR